MTTKKKVWLGIGAAAVVAIAYFGYPVVRFGVGLYRKGVFDPVEKREYDGNSIENLKAIHTALMLYQDSEGALPPAGTWMDAAWLRLQTADMNEDEAKKKLKRNPEKGDEYGYAFNEAVGGKHTLDLPETTILVFETSDLSWNAHGKMDDPAARAVTIKGAIVEPKN